MMYVLVLVFYGAAMMFLINMFTSPTDNDLKRAQRPPQPQWDRVMPTVPIYRVTGPLKPYQARHAATSTARPYRRHRPQGGVHKVSVDQRLEIFVENTRSRLGCGKHSFEGRLMAAALLES
jgi:hypothetical protein